MATSIYFSKFPIITYDFPDKNGKQTFILVRDITANIRFVNEIIQNIIDFEFYDIVDGETPEIISERFYGTPSYHWVLMILNLKFDYIEDFPLATFELEQYITAKYGAGHEHDIHHWEDPNTGYIVDKGTPGSVSVDNYDFEVQRNEAKRRIKILDPVMLQSVLKQFESILP